MIPAIRLIAFLSIVGLLTFILPEDALSQTSNPPAVHHKTTYDAVVAGRTCHARAGNPNALECKYVVGEDCEIIITDVGPGARIVFARSSMYGDYYGSYGLLYGCAIISSGFKIEDRRFDWAFISLINGKVYKDADECRAAK